jgi:3-deoxy-manno-octulosonate cytidylyltransferase (CMP-KDO synthetase)
MLQNKKVTCVIPARLRSTRFPKKALALLCGKPTIQWVWEAAKKVYVFDTVLFAIDSEEVAEVIDSFGGKYVMTSESCKSGTDRLIEIAKKGDIKSDIWVNWQGDEPFANEEMIHDILQSSVEDMNSGEVGIWTLKKKIVKEEEVTAVNFAKLVCDHNGNALYFSRSPIPCCRDASVPFEKRSYYKHVGMYAFSTEALLSIGEMQSSDLEDAEALEQLRFLQNGSKVKVHETSYEVIGIDTPEDLERAEKRMLSE